MNKPTDAKVREAVQNIFNTQPSENPNDGFSAELKNRELLHHWPLSRVERLTFRSEQLPGLIFKAILPPLQNEVGIYQDVFQDNRRWTPTFYGAVQVGEEIWMFMEDVGKRTFKNEPTTENLQKVTATLAGLHVTFGREVNNGQLQQRTKLAVRDYPAYISGARQAIILTRALVNKNLFPAVTPRHLALLEAVANMYDRVAIALVSAPQTLVHGDFNPQNILFDEASGERIFIIDWANAYIGAGLLDLVDLTTFATAQYGPGIMPRLLQYYRSAYRAASGEPLAAEPLEQLFVCAQIEKKMGLIRWYDQCALKWIPSGVIAYNYMVAGLIEEAYELSSILT